MPSEEEEIVVVGTPPKPEDGPIGDNPGPGTGPTQPPNPTPPPSGG
jgi:hypothetical protein